MTLFEQYVFRGLIVFALCLLAFLAGSKMRDFTPPEQTDVDRQLSQELDQVSAKLQALIETERSKLPAGTVYATPPPVKVGSIQWQADISVKIQYLRWQIEFLITLRSLEQTKPPGTGPPRPIGAVGGSNK